jgi:hypothetical protein
LFSKSRWVPLSPRLVKVKTFPQVWFKLFT